MLLKRELFLSKPQFTKFKNVSSIQKNDLCNQSQQKDSFKKSEMSFTASPKSLSEKKVNIIFALSALLAGISMSAKVIKVSSSDGKAQADHLNTAQVDSVIDANAIKTSLNPSLSESLEVIAEQEDESIEEQDEEAIEEEKVPEKAAVAQTQEKLPLKATTSDPRAIKYQKKLETMKIKLTENQKGDLAAFEKIYQDNKEKYESVAKKLGVDEKLIPLTSRAVWAIHAREGGCDFGTYLHNGEPLGRTTRLVPAGIFFRKDQWEDAALDALKGEIKDFGYETPKSLPEWMSFSEKYNGLGYENKGVASPYVLAGTDAYNRGKYVRDRVYDANYRDTQLGVTALIKEGMRVEAENQKSATNKR